MTTPNNAAKMTTIRTRAETGMTTGREPLNSDPGGVGKFEAHANVLRKTNNSMIWYHCKTYTTDGICALTLHGQLDCCTGLLLFMPEDGSTGEAFDPISSCSHESDRGGRLPDALRRPGVRDLTGEVRDTPWEHWRMRWTCVRHRTRDRNRWASIDFCWNWGHHWFFWGSWACKPLLSIIKQTDK